MAPQFEESCHLRLHQAVCCVDCEREALNACVDRFRKLLLQLRGPVGEVVSSLLSMCEVEAVKDLCRTLRAQDKFLARLRVLAWPRGVTFSISYIGGQQVLAFGFVFFQRASCVLPGCISACLAFFQRASCVFGGPSFSVNSVTALSPTRFTEAEEALKPILEAKMARCLQPSLSLYTFP